mgnify:CR=1 FL=1
MDGTESFFYYMAKKFKDRDITFLYQVGHVDQVNRLKKYARTIRWDGQIVECDKFYINYTPNIMDYVKANEYIQIIHTDYMNQEVGFAPHPLVTRYIGVSPIVCENFKKKFGLECELIYNPVVMDKPRKILHLISATRLTKEKGRDRMEKLGKILNQSGILYDWRVFTDNRREINNPNIIWMRPRLDISDFIAEADYLVQLSNEGEGRGYSIEEALTLGTPVICTPVTAFKDMVEDGKNGWIVPFNMRNIDPEKWLKKPKFTYTPPYSKWNEELKGESTYDPSTAPLSYKCIKRYDDTIIGKRIEIGEAVECDEARAKYLKNKGVLE